MEASPTSANAQGAFRARVVERLGVSGVGRRERIVHTLDGLEDTATARQLQDCCAELWDRCRGQVPGLAGIDYLLGLDAGGILPTVGLALISGLPYKIAWKLRLPLPGAVHFVEPHATRPDVYAYGIETGRRVLLVDDEVTTGYTLANLAARLREAGAEPVGAACLVEGTRFGARDLLAAAGVPLVSLLVLNGAA